VKRRSWNELKTEVLSLLKDNPGTTSKDISAALEVSMSNAGMILHRFARASVLLIRFLCVNLCLSCEHGDASRFFRSVQPQRYNRV